MAQREGVKAVVDGQVTGVGTGYIVSLRLVSADSGTELASFQESGDGPRGLIDAADKLARELRGRIGESLRSVQGTPPLAQATTASLEALRMFSQGLRANGIEENPLAAAQFARQAVAIDSNFSSAWRLLSVAVNNSGGSRSEADSAIERAYRLRDRLPEMERLQTEAYYFLEGPHRDRSRALTAYLALLERGDSIVAPVNAGEVLRTERAYARAESLDVIAMRHSREPGIAAGNAIELELDQGHADSALSMLQYWKKRSPDAHGIRLHDLIVRYAQGDTAGYMHLVDSLQQSSDAVYRLWGVSTHAAASVLHGRLAEAARFGRERAALLPATDAQRLSQAILAATLDAWFHGPSPRAVQTLNAALTDTPLQRIPMADRPYFGVASAYALAGDADKAAGVIAEYRRSVTDTSQLRLTAPELHEALGVVALARGDAKSALDEFRRSDIAYDGLPSNECAPCIHFDLARAFDALGQADSAIAEYQAYLAAPYFQKLFGGENVNITFGDAMVLAGLHKRLGELYEAKGDRRQAAEHYVAFVALWKNADPELQPEVEDVRRRLVRLSDTEARPRVQ